MTPPLSQTTDEAPDYELLPEALPVDATLAWWVRGILVAVALLLCAVFAVAVYLDPYERDEAGAVVGRKLKATHRGLGLPPCSFLEMTGRPCPSCGMTTSFALLVRGDLVHSARANFVGTGLAITGLVFIAWAFASVWRGRLVYVRSFERWLTVGVCTLMAAMVLRWGALLGLAWYTGTPWW